jgi:hypothetical protein
MIKMIKFLGIIFVILIAVIAVSLTVALCYCLPDILTQIFHKDFTRNIASKDGVDYISLNITILNTVIVFFMASIGISSFIGYQSLKKAVVKKAKEIASEESKKVFDRWLNNVPDTEEINQQAKIDKNIPKENLEEIKNI